MSRSSRGGGITRRSAAAPATGGQERIARTTIFVYSVVSVLTLVAWPLRRFSSGRGWVDVVGDVLNLPLAYGLFGALLLFLLTGALLRRKRFALWIVVVLQIAGIALAVALALRSITGHRIPALRHLEFDTGSQVSTYAGGIFGAFASYGLWWARPAFPARRSPGSLWATVLTLTVGLGVSITVAITLAELFGGSLSHPATPVLQGVRAALGLNDLIGGSPRNHHLPDWIAWLGSTLSAVVVVVALGVFLRSGQVRQTLDGQTELAVRKLLLSSPHQDSLGYFATRRDKTVFFGPDGRAAISYRVIASVALASADPLGPREAWPATIDAWLTQARTYGWVPAALSPGREAAQAYVQAGLRAVPLGDEAIIDVSSFSLDGPARRAVRQAVVKVRRAGYTVSIRRHRDIDAAEMKTLAGYAEQWRGDATERGFSMALSRLGDPADGSALMVVVHRPDGVPAGLLSLVPWGRHGASLDLMRRDHHDLNGLVETMVTTLLQRSSEFGLRRISLNFAMFRAVFADAEQFGAGPVTRLNNAVLGVFSRFFQLESLYRSNAKYLPAWVPRYVCIDSPLSLLRVSVAAGVAEGFLPQLGRRRQLTAQATDGWLAAAVAEAEKQAADVKPPPLRRPREQERVRRQRLAALEAAGMPGYPVTVARTGTLADVLAATDGTPVSATGRVDAMRDFGGVLFAVLFGDGEVVQAILDRATLPQPALRLWRATVDRGDVVSVTGILGASRTGHRSLLVASWQMAAKSLTPLPSRRTGLTDPEARARNRVADLIVNADSAAVLAARSRAVDALRTAFRSRGFREVQTPILQSVHGGAAARPFTTHINAYDENLSLRIAPELFLKRLVVAGSGPVFEMGANFRNEGADATHNPEFTSLEAYLPFADYSTMREMITDVILAVAVAVHGAPVALRPGPTGAPVSVDLSPPWTVRPVYGAVSAACGVPVDPETPVESLHRIARARAVPAHSGMSSGQLVMRLYDHLVEAHTFLPTFYTDFPLETSPLTRAHRDDGRLSERWDLVAFGMELGTGYSELVDPIDQRARLTAQSLRAAAGDEEAMQIDEEFLKALELGMPPTGGLGLGVDRLVMMLTGRPIRAVLTFPFIRRRAT